jgi:hypothetical protein
VDHYARNAWFALLQQRIGNHQAWGMFGRAYQGNADRVGGGSASTSGLGAVQWSVGYSYRIAKTADVFASYYELRNDRSASYSAFPGFGAVAPGADTRGAGIGILYTFDAAWTVKKP